MSNYLLRKFILNQITQKQRKTACEECVFSVVWDSYIKINRDVMAGEGILVETHGRLFLMIKMIIEERHS